MSKGRGRCTASSAPSFYRRSKRPAAAIKQRVPADISGDRVALTLEQYSANLGISSWEIDFFGRIRSLEKRALEEYFATEQARRSAQILLVSEVANAYLTLAADRENLKLAQSTLESPAGRLQFNSTAL